MAFDLDGIAVDFREAQADKPDEINFFLASWIKAMQPAYRKMSTQKHHDLIEGQINRIMPQAELLVACLHEDHDVILGFICYEPTLLHFCYVKKDWRKLGLARELLRRAELHAEATFNSHTFLTSAGEAYLTTHHLHWHYRTVH